MQRDGRQEKTRLKYKAGAFEPPTNERPFEPYYGTDFFPGTMGLSHAGYGMGYMPQPQIDMFTMPFGNQEYVEEEVHVVKPKM